MRAMDTDKNAGRESITQLLVNKDLYGVVNPVESYQMALGRLSVEFSLLHFLLEKISWELWVLSPTVGSIITKDLRATHLVEKLHASADKVLLPVHKKEFCALLKRAREIAETRNEWLHRLWMLDDGEPVFCVSKKHGIIRGTNVPSLAKLGEFNNSILELAGELVEFEKARGKGTS